MQLHASGDYFETDHTLQNQNMLYEFFTHKKNISIFFLDWLGG